MSSVRAMLGSFGPGGSFAARPARSTWRSLRIRFSGLVESSGGEAIAIAARIERALAGGPGGRGGQLLARVGVVGSERPEVALEVAGAVLGRAVVHVGELADDLGARRPRALVVSVGIVDDRVDRDRRGERVGGLAAHPALVRALAEHDDAGAEPKLGVVDGPVIAAVDGLLHDPEPRLQPLDRGVGVAVSQRGEYVRSRLGHRLLLSMKSRRALA